MFVPKNEAIKHCHGVYASQLPPLPTGLGPGLGGLDNIPMPYDQSFILLLLEKRYELWSSS
jgi:hypothetical protein